MRFAIIYRPGNNVAPPEQIPDMVQATGEWMQRNGDRFETTEFLVGGGGFAVIDTDDAELTQRLITENPFMPYAEVEIRPLVDPAKALGILNEVYSNR